MSEVTIKFNFDTSGVNTVDDMIGRLRELDDLGKSSGGSSGGIGGLGAGIMSMASGVGAFANTAGKVIDVVSDLNKAGTEALRTQAAFEAFSNGKADEYLNRMIVSTRGLVDDTVLMSAATRALSTNAVKTGDDLQRLAADGATLGVTFAGSAEKGINKLESALEAVGNVRALRALGIDADEVRKKWGELQATMSKEDAWRLAVLEQADETARKLPNALEGAGTAVERFGVRLGEFRDNVAKGVSTVLNDLLREFEELGEFMDNYGKKRGSGPGADGTGTNAAIPGPLMNANYIQEFARTHPSQSGYGFASLGLTPGEYYRGLTGGAYGDNGQTGLSQLPRIPYWMMSGTPGFDFSKYVTSGPSFSSQQQYGYTPRTDEQDYLLRHPEMRGMYSNGQFDPLRDPGLGHAGRWASGRVDDSVAMEALRNIVHKTHDTFLDVEIAAKGIIKPFQDASDAYAKDAERRRGIQSVSDAFGVQKDGFYNEMQGGMGDAFQARRDQVQADLERRYGRGSKKVQQGLDQYDQQAKIEMDKYGLATKQTTPELIYFRDAQAGLNERLRTGKISMSEYTAQILAMSAAAKDGKVDINSLIDLNYAPQIKAAGRKAGNIRWQANDEKNNAAMEGKDGQIKDNVLTAMKKEANEAETAINAANTAVGNVVTGLTAKIPDAVKALEPFGGAVSGILDELTTLANMSFNVQITTTQTKIGGGGPGKGKTKGPGQIGYFN